MHIHANKTKDFVGSHQTLLFSSQSEAIILWVNCTELALFCTVLQKNELLAVGQSESSNFVTLTTKENIIRLGIIIYLSVFLIATF